ncbi:RimJ/RimL family protein N-acetyltransferase [Paenibacillus rhizosphaerae]|uniref:RimJ/RimL family protein N-acetyltransferase n=1 Tax=Paenibacillus rhizosphaerae TaxID=297318 RepID=A0A839TPK1_9BACL|nr:GNAT family N-acetyltransferase [Paenibacillus rhizosphaerae]MBB3128695.1 RimJ/RimL family protein N-acetyltransferase [Paenibacillus rhizosphaerae]
MRKVMVTERLTLRPLELHDAESMAKLAGEKEVADTTLNMPHPYPTGSATSFIKARHEAAERGDGYSFAVTLTEDNAFLGVVGLHVNKRHNMAELAYWIGKPYWRCGFCTEAAAKVVQFAFDELKLNRVFAAAMTRNPASYKVMEKIGMKYEGILRNHIRKGDVYEDLRHYGLLRSDD